MSTLNHQSIVSTLREIEVKAAQIDPGTPYSERDAIPRFYSLCMAKRGYGVASGVLRDWLAEDFGVSPATASQAIRAAHDAGKIKRDGAGSATRYYTIAYEAEQEQAAMRKDRDLISLGARAIGVGLLVHYDADRWDAGFSHGVALQRAREGKHLHSVSLHMSLTEVIEALETAGVSL